MFISCLGNNYFQPPPLTLNTNPHSRLWTLKIVNNIPYLNYGIPPFYIYVFSVSVPFLRVKFIFFFPQSYNASSPDDRALVEGASDMGFTFHDRQPLEDFEVVHVKTPRGNEQYEILNIIEFTSTRKRMSVIVRTPDGRIKLYIKGADSVILARLGDDPTACHKRKHEQNTIEHLDAFAAEGLRTLCCATREIPEDRYV